MAKESIKVGILMGSESDLSIMKEAKQALKRFGIHSEMRVLSAHRCPEETALYAKTASSRGISVLIAGAGGAAHLAGALAAHSTLPVIGVPIASTPLQGQDALFATVQMPKGMPVATVAINGAWNAGLLAAKILALSDPVIAKKLVQYRQEIRLKVTKTRV